MNNLFGDSPDTLRYVALAGLLAVLLGTYAARHRIAGMLSSGGSSGGGYATISQDEAKRIIADGDVVIVDVRSSNEFATGHIPGALCVPAKTISAADTSVLPDRNQAIMVYCKTGMRSKKAAATLARLGYTKVFNIGGISSWTGDVVAD